MFKNTLHMQINSVVIRSHVALTYFKFVWVKNGLREIKSVGRINLFIIIE